MRKYRLMMEPPARPRVDHNVVGSTWIAREEENRASALHC